MAGSESGGAKTNLLAENAIGMWSLVFFVLAALAPLTLIVTVAPLHFLKGGAAVPSGYLIAGAVLALFAVGFTTMSRHVRNAGAFYAYIARGLGKPMGTGSAMVALLAYNALQISTYGALGVYVSGTLNDFFGVSVHWVIPAIIGVGIVGFLGYRGIETSSKILSVLLILETSVLVVLIVPVLLKGGLSGYSFDSFSPSNVFVLSNGAMLALTFGAFMGFEATAIFSEEAKDPRKTVPRATYVAVAFIAIFYCLVTYAIVLAYGPANILAVATNDPVNMVFTMSDEWVSPLFTDVMRVLIITSVFAALLALHNAANRYFYALGREKVLPSALGKTHPKTKSPWVAGMVQTVLAAVVVLGFFIFRGDPYLQLLLWGSAVAFVGIIALETFCAAAVIRYLRTNVPEVGLWQSTIAPGLGLLGLCIIFVLVLNSLSFLSGIVGFGGNLVLYGSVPLVFIAGFVRALWMRDREPGAYETLATVNVD